MLSSTYSRVVCSISPASYALSGLPKVVSRRGTLFHASRSILDPNAVLGKEKPLPFLGTKATWLAVSDVPPLATLDDVLVEITRVVRTELNRGIVDLTRTESMLRDTLGHTTTGSSSTASADTTDLEDDDSVHISVQIQEDDPSLPEDVYEEDDEDDEPVHRSIFPLWNPSVFTTTHPNLTLPSHFVLEAHVMLSTLARPMGWYLKFPDRSVVNAILQHVEEAQKLRNTFNKEQKRKRMEVKKMKQLQDKGSSDHNNNYNIEDTITSERGEDYNESDQDLFSWELQSSRPLICAGKELDVAPFFFQDQLYNKQDTIMSPSTSSTTNTDIHMDQQHPYPTEEDLRSVPRMLRKPYYHEYKTLIDETIVRVENCSVESTADDVRYFFRRFDLKHDKLSSVPPILQIKSATPNRFVHREDLHPNEAESHSSLPSLTNQNSKKKTPSATKSFLVRFHNAANARAALRELQHAEFMGRKVKLAQYSRQIL